MLNTCIKILLLIQTISTNCIINGLTSNFETQQSDIELKNGQFRKFICRPGYFFKSVKISVIAKCIQENSNNAEVINDLNCLAKDCEIGKISLGSFDSTCITGNTLHGGCEFTCLPFANINDKNSAYLHCNKKNNKTNKDPTCEYNTCPEPTHEPGITPYKLEGDNCKWNIEDGKMAGCCDVIAKPGFTKQGVISRSCCSLEHSTKPPSFTFIAKMCPYTIPLHGNFFENCIDPSKNQIIGSCDLSCDLGFNINGKQKETVNCDDEFNKVCTPNNCLKLKKFQKNVIYSGDGCIEKNNDFSGSCDIRSTPGHHFSMGGVIVDHFEIYCGIDHKVKSKSDMSDIDTDENTCNVNVVNGKFESNYNSGILSISAIFACNEGFSLLVGKVRYERKKITCLKNKSVDILPNCEKNICDKDFLKDEIFSGQDCTNEANTSYGGKCNVSTRENYGFYDANGKEINDVYVYCNKNNVNVIVPLVSLKGRLCNSVVTERGSFDTSCFSGRTLNTSCQFNCDGGFSIDDSASKTFECLKNNRLNGNPVCIGNECTKKVVENVSYSGVDCIDKGNSYKQVCTITSAPGYYLEDGNTNEIFNSTITTCLVGGVNSLDNISNNIISCLVNISNGFFKPKCLLPNGNVNGKCEMGCIEGTALFYDNQFYIETEVVCTITKNKVISSNFGDKIDCIKTDCGKIDIEHGKIFLNKGKLFFKAKYLCSWLYKPKTETQIFCLSNTENDKFSWKPKPECEYAGINLPFIIISTGTAVIMVIFTTTAIYLAKVSSDSKRRTMELSSNDQFVIS